MFYVQDFCKDNCRTSFFLGCTACTQKKKLGAQRESLGAPCTRAPANFEHWTYINLPSSERADIPAV